MCSYEIMNLLCEVYNVNKYIGEKMRLMLNTYL